MKNYRSLITISALALTLTVVAGCHNNPEVGVEVPGGIEDGIEDGTTVEDLMISSVDVEGRTLVVNFNQAVPSAGTSVKANELTRSQIETLFRIRKANNSIATPLTFRWAAENQLRVSGPLSYCESYRVELLDDEVQATIGFNPNDWYRSGDCTAALPYYAGDGLEGNLMILPGDLLFTDFNIFHGVIDDAYWNYRSEDLTKDFILTQHIADGVAFASATDYGGPTHQLVRWDDPTGSTEPDAGIIVPTLSPMFKYKIWNDVGDVDGDGINDTAVVGTESTTGKDLITHLHIISGKRTVGTNAELASVTDYTFDTGVPNERTGYLSRMFLGDVDGDGKDDIPVVKKTLDDSNKYKSLYTFELFSGKDVIANDSSSPIVTIVDSEELVQYSESLGADMNCDGLKDIVISSFEFVYNSDPLVDDYERKKQRLLVYFRDGNGFGASSFADADVIMATEIDYTGRTQIENLGDLNADGCDDLLLLVIPDGGDTKQGGIILGRESWDPTYLMEEMSAVVPINAGAGYDKLHRLTRSRSAPGDLNNDGYDDVIIECYADSVMDDRSYAIFSGKTIASMPNVIGCADATHHRACTCGGAVSGSEQVLVLDWECRNALANFLDFNYHLECGLPELVDNSGWPSDDVRSGLGKSHEVVYADVEAYFSSPDGDSFMANYLQGDETLRDAIVNASLDGWISSVDIIKNLPWEYGIKGPMPNCAAPAGSCAGDEQCNSIMSAFVFLPTCVKAETAP